MEGNKFDQFGELVAGIKRGPLSDIPEKERFTFSTELQKVLLKQDPAPERIVLTTMEVGVLKTLCTVLEIDIREFRKYVGTSDFPNRAFYEHDSRQQKKSIVRRVVLEKMSEYYLQKYAELPIERQKNARRLLEHMKLICLKK